MRSDALTVDEYLAELPPERRDAIAAVRRTALDSLPDGYCEMMDFGMISYVIPLEDYPKTYNKHPLMLAAIASQKRYMAVYLNNIYSSADTAALVPRRLPRQRQEAGHGQVLRTLQDS